MGTTAGRRPGRHCHFRPFPPASRGHPHHRPKLSASQSKRQQRPGGRKETMSFSLFTVACRGTPKKNPGPAVSSNRDWMLSQSTGDPVLRLYSCRALSPEPRTKTTKSTLNNNSKQPTYRPPGKVILIAPEE